MKNRNSFTEREKTIYEAGRKAGENTMLILAPIFASASFIILRIILHLAHIHIIIHWGN